MRQLVLRIAGFAGILAASAAGQCRLDPWLNGLAAIDQGRAIVSSASFPGIPVVHFLAKSSQGWQQESSLVLGVIPAFSLSPVAIDGDRALAGAPESGAGLAGRAFVYDRVGGQWVATELLSTTIHDGDYFGSVVALDGEVAVVGADHWPMGGGDGLGVVHVFERQGGSWTEVIQLPIHPSAIDIEGSTIVVGDRLVTRGRVEIYERIGGTWILTQTFVGASPYGGWLGNAVDLQGDTLVVGPRSSYARPGYVQVYLRQSGTWQLVQRLHASDSAAGDGFGEGLALSGSTLLVGATGSEGRVHRFEHDGAAYVETSRIVPEPGTFSFGWTVALDGEDALLGGFPNSHFYRLGFAEADSFCPATPNSTGARGVLSVEGCDSRSGERLTLVANRLPQGVFGFTLFGLNTTQLPFGDGTLCIGAPRFRLPAEVSDTSGTLVHDVDFGAWPGSILAAGRTWKFQTAFRDPGSSGARLNLTNALAIRITP